MKQIDGFLDFLLFEKGEPVTINLIPRQAMVTDASRSTDHYFSDKQIRTKEPISTGALVAYQDETWMIISQVDKNAVSQQARIRKCNHVTKLIVEDWLYELPGILEMVSLSVSSNVDIRVATGNMRVTLQNNKITSKIAINDRFIASLAAWKIVGLDYTKTGLIIMTAERDVFQSGDDQENEIANADALPTWSISMQPDSLSVATQGTGTIVATLYKGLQAQTDATFLWHSSDSDIAAVIDGAVSGIAEGETTITAVWAKHPTIQAATVVTVVDNPPVIITYAFYSTTTTGTEKTYTDFDIRHTDTRNLCVEKRINGVAAEVNDTYAFTFNPNGATTNNYTYTVLNTYSVQIKNKQIYANPVTLTAVSNETGEIISISFRLKSMF